MATTSTRRSAALQVVIVGLSTFAWSAESSTWLICRTWRRSSFERSHRSIKKRSFPVLSQMLPDQVQRKAIDERGGAFFAGAYRHGPMEESPGSVQLAARGLGRYRSWRTTFVSEFLSVLYDQEAKLHRYSGNEPLPISCTPKSCNSPHIAGVFPPCCERYSTLHPSGQSSSAAVCILGS